MLKVSLDKTNPFYLLLSKGVKPFHDAWENCVIGGWMLDIAGFIKADLRKLSLARGECAMLVIEFMKDKRSIDGVQAVLDFGNGLISDEQMKSFTDNAITAAYQVGVGASGYSHLLSYAARSAADATGVFHGNTGGVAYAVADTLKEADPFTDMNIVRAAAQKKIADICRRILTDAVYQRLDEIGTDYWNDDYVKLT